MVAEFRKVKEKPAAMVMPCGAEGRDKELQVAGCSEEIFTPESISSIHGYTGGVPRLINTICDNAILEGFFVKAKPIDKGIIESIAKNLDLNPNGAGAELKEAEVEADEANEVADEKDESGQEDQG